ncbi:acyl-CoA thioester hydrolase [Chitinophaga terrae (ex Kim and Jung 2007)]|jgi:acyl-CoA thioester hydrolase|uniref:Acyl-CoA thioester hydrolase n=1 Tax=Chitinophaga terrae (ex Kim and Jung 2007) TaxID=408074 RepID=A0A1H3ZYE3_9BACT|nr:acyl-CoA thioesterase [Chitinophaga terrae (ex Kim and Jung 2007)]MDQ0106144.1 acyl-CoA thioester hydrolase [Chitinophaga terrae (ex Kim and Jung 2007)]GEP93155.1 4-hydroxybenzoyl-CoA thioesterase [Chitinophaga terrae (ex Kim and Jung 2007)]SEA28302.1 acyl-CoA thioester hydrolase [Chitinophaga terrae (ex Kim and Jung 2007)]
MSITARTEILIRFNEADPLGIVWHGHYVRYFEDGREAFGEKYGLRYLDIFAEGYTVPVVNIQCDYKRSLRYGDKVVVETKFIDDLAAKIRFEYTLTNPASGEIVAKGSSVQVFLDKETNTLQLITPAFFTEWKKRHGLI